MRSYLTEREVERLMATARKHSRYGARDAAMILIGYRHGLRASELCGLQWTEVSSTLAACMFAERRAVTPGFIPWLVSRSERFANSAASIPKADMCSSLSEADR